MADDEIYDPNRPSFIYSEEFLNAAMRAKTVINSFLKSADDTKAILRTHAHIDDLMSNIILRKAPYAEVFINLKKAGFVRKSEILYKLKVIDLKTLNLLKTLTDIRDKFAHDLELVNFIEADDLKTTSLMNEKVLAQIDSVDGLLNRRRKNKVGYKVRQVLGAILLTFVFLPHEAPPGYKPPPR